jgi:hypothetical protein
MEDRLGPSRLNEVVQPFLLFGVFLLTIGVAGLALSYDELRATRTIGILAIAVLIASLIAIGPYLGSIVAQGVGAVSFPLVGVRVAAAGCAGFALLIGLAVSSPLGSIEGLLAIGAGVGLIALAWVRRPTRTGRTSER